MAPHSSTLAWEIPWMEEPGGLQSMGSLRVGHDWATSLSPFTFISEKEMATHSSVLAWRIWGTGEPGGLPSIGSHRVGHDWNDLAAAAAEQEREWNWRGKEKDGSFMYLFLFCFNEYSCNWWSQQAYKFICMTPTLKKNIWVENRPKKILTDRYK